MLDQRTTDTDLNARMFSPIATFAVQGLAACVSWCYVREDISVSRDVDEPPIPAWDKLALDEWWP